MKQIAIIGPTASGKSDLAIEMALKHNAYILSIDSLSIYKEIDIASAKPPHEDLQKVKHYGINTLPLNEHFDVAIFIKLYNEVKMQAQDDGKNLIIVGGTSFYLKSLVSGLSQLPTYSQKSLLKAKEMLLDLEAAHHYLKALDPSYMAEIKPTDAYRIEKMLLLALESGMSPTSWFKKHPPKAVIEDLSIFNIDVERPLLRERIIKRTKTMMETGLIDEVTFLEHKYGRNHNAMKAIGIIEVLGYLDGDLTYDEMVEEIIIHTAQLAKRQQTFNRTQFGSITSTTLELLPSEIDLAFGNVKI